MFRKIFNIPNITLLTGLCLSVIAEWYSITGLTAIFAAAVIPIIIMGVTFGISKVVTTVYLKTFWSNIDWRLKFYMVFAVLVLSLITSMGIFGFLSKAHSEQSLVSGDIQAKLAIYDEKIKTARENIENDRKELKQMDDAVDQIMARSTSEEGATKSNNIRRSQQRDRLALAKDIEANQKLISSLNEEAAPIRAENRKVEAEVGPIKYIAALIYGDNLDSNLLERAVRWVIILLVLVFDPLALVLVIAGNNGKKYLENLNIVSEKNEKIDDKINTIENLVPNSTKEQVKSEEVKTEEQTSIDESMVENVYDWSKHGYLNKPFDHFTNLTPMVYKNDTVEVQEQSNKPKEYKELPTGYVSYEGKHMSKDALKVLRPDLFIPNKSLGKSVNSSFGTTFPNNAVKGDIFVRVDTLPNKVFKYDGAKWIEINKESTDTYLYDIRYIQYLIKKIELGEYDVELLSDQEKQQIENYLKNQKK